MKTEAWVLPRGGRDAEPGELRLETIELPPMGEHDLLVEPLFGSWEANNMHALQRAPVDICRLRRESHVVLGNAGVLRVLAVGAEVVGVSEGDIGLLAPIGTSDDQGYTVRVFGYDSPGTVGLMAKRTVVPEHAFVPLAPDTRYDLARWAGFPIRYATAWENWKVAYGVWQLTDGSTPDKTFVCGWGGGVSWAELQLAQHMGCQTAMVASTDERLRQLREIGIQPIDRREFSQLEYDPARYDTDRAYRAGYLQAVGVFLREIEQFSGGRGISIFIDNIGQPVMPATLRSLGRRGIVTTSGWRHGHELTYNRVTACVERHTLIHTHGCRRSDGCDAVRYAEGHGWLPPENPPRYRWEDIPRLAEDYAQGRIDSYFPVYEVNPT